MVEDPSNINDQAHDYSRGYSHPNPQITYPTRSTPTSNRKVARIVAVIIGLGSVYLAWVVATVNVNIMGYGASRSSSATLADLLSNSANSSISLGGGIFILGCLIGFVVSYAVVIQILGLIIIIPNLTSAAGAGSLGFSYSTSSSVGIGVGVAVLSVLIMLIIAALDYDDRVLLN